MEGKSSPPTLRYTVSATDSPSTSNFDCPQRVCGAVCPKLVAIWIRSLESLGNSSTTNTNCRAGFSGKYSNPWNLFCCAGVNGEFWSPPKYWCLACCNHQSLTLFCLAPLGPVALAILISLGLCYKLFDAPAMILMRLEILALPGVYNKPVLASPAQA